jgi:hypothetical protein
MQMQQVQYFLALCEELNFSRAARRRGVSQPTLTTAIRARAGAGRSAVSPKAFDRLDRARARGAALPGRNRAQRGSRPRGCTEVDTASGRRPISPASGGQFGAAIESIPNGWRLAIVCEGCGGWVVGYFDCGGDFASSSALSARRSGSASIRNTANYCGHKPAHASKRMPPSMISTRPGQFAFSPNPAPGLRGSRVISSAGFIAASRGTAEDFRRLASLSRPRQIG